ncbi:MAG: hypothetical protein DRI65_13095 [Chloroflexota bacterium]|nr:MAG: hypothetical protein DRI65_13095 [Chloroflexota bacterium]HDD62126.1 hypothetical protein [Chloroflexota bacterium]
MKMILAIMPTSISEPVSTKLLEADYRVTKFASTAGFLSGGTTTLMVVADANKVENALEIIRNHIPTAAPTDIAHARVTIYVMPAKDFERV